MNNEIKIPTILALAILTIGLGVGVYLLTQNQNLKSKASISAVPKNVAIANVGPKSASIYWQTDVPAPGFVKAGTDNSLNQIFRDDRDKGAPLQHQIHFVTLNNLSPNTVYYYQISSGASVYPQKEPLKFTTSPDLPPSDYRPVIGTVVDSAQHPIEEAIVILQIPGAQTLASVTKVSGSFIIPLTEIKDTALSKNFILSANSTSADITASNWHGSSKSKVAINNSGVQIPPITLGGIIPTASITNTPLPPVATASAQIKRFDLNSDGKVDNLDISIVLKNFGTKPKQKEADFNKDGIVDQKDLQAIRDAMTKQ